MTNTREENAEEMARNESAPKFTQTFDSYVCVGDTITLETGGFTFTARIEFDDHSSIDDDDVHNLDVHDDDAIRNQIEEARAAFERDDWFYCGVVVAVSKAGIELPGVASLWGIECNYPDSDNAYLTEVANELLDEALEVGRTTLLEMLTKLTDGQELGVDTDGCIICWDADKQEAYNSGDLS